MRKLFGIWLITSKRSFFDPAIWREDSQSIALQTRLQRAAGVRYRGTRYPKFPDAATGFGNIMPGHKYRSIGQLFKGHYHPGPITRRLLSLKRGHRSVLARATGYALMSTRRLQPVSIPGAIFIGHMRVSVNEDAAC